MLIRWILTSYFIVGFAFAGDCARVTFVLIFEGVKSSSTYLEIIYIEVELGGATGEFGFDSRRGANACTLGN